MTNQTKVCKNGLIDQVGGQDGWILAKIFVLQDGVEFHKLPKKRTRPMLSHLDRTSLVDKGFIIWFSWKFINGTRWVVPCRNDSSIGSQPQRKIWFILPARGA